MLNLPADAMPRAVIQGAREKLRLVEVNEKGVVMDIDTRAAYQRALEWGKCLSKRHSRRQFRNMMRTPHFSDMLQCCAAFINVAIVSWICNCGSQFLRHRKMIKLDQIPYGCHLILAFNIVLS